MQELSTTASMDIGQEKIHRVGCSHHKAYTTWWFGESGEALGPCCTCQALQPQASKVPPIEEMEEEEEQHPYYNMYSEEQEHEDMLHLDMQDQMKQIQEALEEFNMFMECN